MVRGSVLSDAANEEDIEQDQITTMVASGLRGSLLYLPDDNELYDPTGGVARLLKRDNEEDAPTTSTLFGQRSEPPPR
ncbi:hypothetical protein RRF57_009160 [Xylaria bambusicola]|uniref:Uncharacterized protein n=1 Tax=Xylaria bambusicola TaxID=326684 RepID=A0AAN7UWF3_9PEZI